MRSGLCLPPASFALALLGLGALSAAGCRKEPAPERAPAASASAARKPLDRLTPGELAPGEEDLFGLPIPSGMTAQGKFKDFAVATGQVRADAVANYVRDHVVVERVEVGAARTVFPAARIKADASGRIFRIEVLADGSATRLLVRDITPPPVATVPAPRVSPDELWRRAGFTRDGKPLNPKALE